MLQRQATEKAAAVKIAVWWKRRSETREARQTLKRSRQLLPLSSLDRRSQEEERQAAATKILCFLQDIQRGHRFVRAVQTFQFKVVAVHHHYHGACQWGIMTLLGAYLSQVHR